jgi:hypothetical protein
MVESKKNMQKKPSKENTLDLVTAAISKQFVDSEEIVMVCERIKKIKSQGGNDNKSRIYIMTFDRIYSFKDSLKSRAYDIKDVRAIISSSTNESDLYIFFERLEDLHIATNNRHDVISMLKLRFNNINRNITLRHFSVDDSAL